MIITRSPLRITLGGGGTDLPSYYEGHGGLIVAAAIDKYVYITIHQTFIEELILKYSQMERVATVDEIRHPLLREAMRMLEVPARGLEITSMADLPSGTGLGSSGSFTTALLRALLAIDRQRVSPGDLAERACSIEIDVLGNPVGKQDPYVASFGGVSCFRIAPSGEVSVRPLALDSATLYNLEENLLLFFTGYTRQANRILADQDRRSREGEDEIIDHLHRVKELGERSLEALESGSLSTFGDLLNVHWELKQQRSSSMTNPDIDRWYRLGLANGARGGKIVGAGGGGFLMFYTENRIRLRQAMAEAGLPEVRKRFDFDGTRVVTLS